MSMIPALLSQPLSSTNKHAMLQAYDAVRQSETNTERSRRALEEAQRCLWEAEKHHEQQLAASVTAKAVLQGLLGQASSSSEAVTTTKANTAPRVKGTRTGGANRKQPMVL